MWHAYQLYIQPVQFNNAGKCVWLHVHALEISWKVKKYKYSNIYFKICLLPVKKFIISIGLHTRDNKFEGSHLDASHILCHTCVISRVLHSSGSLYDEPCFIHSYWSTIRDSTATWVKPPDSYWGVASYWNACQLKLRLLWNNACPAVWQRWLKWTAC